ncbi:cytochrome P450 [Kitasatospora sp. NPDC001175]|uniref:cytochrome P450 n=1 Tax=Kitasatospora sp. NPDC001175 TaxID=3157103 RepID=UPI003CFC359D
MARGALPLIGHLGRILRDPMEFFTAARDVGPVVGVRLGPRTAYLVTAPELVRDMLVGRYREFDKGGSYFDAVQSLTGNGLANCPARDHVRQRPLMQPAFHPSVLPRYTEVMSACVEEVTGRWRAGGTLALDEEMRRISSLVATRTLVTSEEGAQAAAEVARALPLLLPALHRRVLIPVSWVHRLPTPGNRRFERLRTGLRESVDQVIAQYRRSGVDQVDQEGDLLSLIMAARSEEDGSGLSDAEVHDQIMSVLLAGIETTASLLSWTFHLLSRHPDVRKKLVVEVREVLGGRTANYRDLAELPYCRRVLTESMRLYPPGALLSRVTTADVELAGRAIPAGSDVFFCSYSLHRDPEVFAEPEVFDPDRWLPERVTSAQRKGLLPFGAGRRKCIGDAFGLVEATIAVATITDRWQLRPADTRPVRPVLRTVLAPSSLRMTVERRDAAEPRGYPRPEGRASAPDTRARR